MDGDIIKAGASFVMTLLALSACTSMPGREDECKAGGPGIACTAQGAVRGKSMAEIVKTVYRYLATCLHTAWKTIRNKKPSVRSTPSNTCFSSLGKEVLPGCSR